VYQLSSNHVTAKAHI